MTREQLMHEFRLNDFQKKVYDRFSDEELMKRYKDIFPWNTTDELLSAIFEKDKRIVNNDKLIISNYNFYKFLAESKYCIIYTNINYIAGMPIKRF